MSGDHCIVVALLQILARSDYGVKKSGYYKQALGPLLLSNWHFRKDNPTNGLDKTLGARFASPKSKGFQWHQVLTLYSQQPSPIPSL